MVSFIILSADCLQTVLRFHDLGFGRFVHRGVVNAIDDGCSLLLQCLNMGFYLLGHVAAAGYDECLIACATLSLQHTVFIDDIHQQALRDIVAVESCTVDIEDRLAEFGCQCSHGMDRELHEQFVGVLLPHITDREVHEEVVIRLSPLQETLTAFYILHEEWGIAPYRVGRTHIDGCIEFPSGPWVILG